MFEVAVSWTAWQKRKETKVLQADHTISGTRSGRKNDNVTIRVVSQAKCSRFCVVAPLIGVSLYQTIY